MMLANRAVAAPSERFPSEVDFECHFDPNGGVTRAWPRSKMGAPSSADQRIGLHVMDHHISVSMTISKHLKAQGDDGEAELNAWLQRNGLCYVFLAQDPKTFASLFPTAVKRPDFLVLIESIGLIAIDAKHHTLFHGDAFSLSLEEELLRVLTFERLFRIPVWYAYKEKGSSDPVWYWISALKALEVGKRRVPAKPREPFLALELKHFAQIRTGEDMALLYTQRHKNLKPMNRSMASRAQADGSK